MLDFYGVTMRSRELVDDYDEAVEALAILGHKGRKGRKALKRYEETREALFAHLRKLEAK